MAAPHFAPSDSDLYAVLDVPHDAHESVLRTRIPALYKEALANSDHRDFATRQNYQELLERLPLCHNILLDAEKREHYDAYLSQSAGGEKGESFDDYLNRITGKNALDARDREGLLAIRDAQNHHTNNAGEAKTSVTSAQSTTGASVASPLLSESEIGASASPSGTAALFIGLFVGLVGLTIGRGLLRLPLGLSVGIALVVAVAGAALWHHLRSRRVS